MREVFDPWTFVIAAYALALAATGAMIAWTWIAMRRAEARRERTRQDAPRKR